ncbi:MAG: type VI secretion system protein TssA [Desulfovibrionaceae bacterium]
MAQEERKAQSATGLDTADATASSDRAGEVGMAAQPLLDWQALSVPIPGDNPCGEDLRYDKVYDAVRDARREDDATLPQGVWETDLKRADWVQVKRLCVDALEKRSKDIQIATWLLEALVKVDHFCGLREGLEYITFLCETYWDNVYPPLEEDDVELRISPFRWINEKLSITVKLIPITKPQTIDAKPYTYADWEAANYLEQVAQRDKKAFMIAERQGKVTRPKFLGSVMFTPEDYYYAAATDLGSSIRNIVKLEALLDERCGVQSPSLIQLRETLVAIEQVVKKLYGEKNGGKSSEAVEENMPEKETTPERENEAQATGSGGIRSRAQAYRMLAEAADYLMITEPHSPTPYLIKRAVSWGNLTLTELLEEIVANRNDLDNIFVLLGLKKRVGEGEEGR